MRAGLLVLVRVWAVAIESLVLKIKNISIPAPAGGVGVSLLLGVVCAWTSPCRRARLNSARNVGASVPFQPGLAIGLAIGLASHRDLGMEIRSMVRTAVNCRLVRLQPYAPFTAAKLNQLPSIAVKSILHRNSQCSV